MKTTCPRRINELGPWEYKEGLDEWRTRSDDGILYCSFCGSLNPEYVLGVMAEPDKCELGPTDKNYKVYVEVPTDGLSNGKFYFQHFSDEQKDRFIELCNQKPQPFKYSYPYGFYVLPFFVRKSTDVNRR